MKVSLELLYHFNCDRCSKWWTVADITPLAGAIVWCPHCGFEGRVPEKVLLGKDFEKPNN